MTFLGVLGWVMCPARSDERTVLALSPRGSNAAAALWVMVTMSLPARSNLSCP